MIKSGIGILSCLEPM